MIHEILAVPWPLFPLDLFYFMNYELIYHKIINRAKSKDRIKLSKDHPNYIYYEAHHIIPKCLGGKGRCDQWKWHPNIVLLTPKEHFICHLLLSYVHPENSKIISSSWLMCNSTYTKSGQPRYQPASRTYERLRLLKNKAKVSDKTRKKQSLAQKGNKNGSGNKGKKYGPPKEKTREKISLANKGRTASNGGRKLKSSSFIECPHCKKIGDNNGGQMKRWHFDNCKLLDKKIIQPA